MLSAAAYARKLECNRNWKAHRRTVDQSFLEAERSSRNRHSKRRYALSKSAIAFAEAFPNQYHQFVKENQSLTTANPSLTTANQRQTTNDVASPVAALHSRPVPTAAELERRRMTNADDTLAQLGIRLD